MSDTQLAYVFLGLMAGVLVGGVVLLLWSFLSRQRRFTFVEFVLYIVLALAIMGIVTGVNPFIPVDALLVQILLNKRILVIASIGLGSCIPMLILSLADALIDRR